MRTVKYDADIQPESDNTSHGIVVDLVGRDKAVLDVGCSTGYLAKALSERGCVVTGVEIDPEAAELARPHLADVHVVDLDQVPLSAVDFGRQFDVVVFADVLEHLKHPVRALRSSAALLGPGGYVVVSIPNVAHGSVRLSLLEGNFDYRDVGLLDDTHIRFFTRATLGELLSSAGFAAVDMRRTTAGVFATEIQVDPTVVPEAVRRRLEVDEDAETYQFVFSAVPVTVSPSDLADALWAANDQLRRLRRQLAEVIHDADLGVLSPTVGIFCGDATTLADGLRRGVVEAELGRRLDGFRFRPLSKSDLKALGTPGLGGGGMAHPDLDVVDVVVVAGRVDRATAQALRRLPADVGVVLLAAAPDESVTDLDDIPGALIGAPSTMARRWTRWSPVPELTVVGDRLFDAELLRQRARFLVLLGQLPGEGRVLLAALSDISGGGGGALVRNVAQVATSLELLAVVVDLPAGEVSPGRVWGLVEPEAVDLVAAVAVAEVVVSDDPVVLALGLALGRPTVGLDAASGPIADLAAWLGEADLSVASLSAVEAALAIARARAADDRALRRLQAALDEPFDRLADAVVDSAGRRSPGTVASRLRDLHDQVGVLAAVNAGLTRRQRAERVAFGLRAAELLGPGPGPSSSAPSRHLRTLASEVEVLRADNVRLAEEAGRARSELDALLATRTFRTLRPAREVYRRFRTFG